MINKEFNNLLVKSADFLKPVAINLTKDSDAADDLYQETLYKALSNSEKYSAGTNIKAWLYTIMRNIFINDYRKKAKRNVVFDKGEGQSLIDARQPTVRNDAEGSIRLKEIKDAIFSLPDIFKIPFQLYVDGYKYNEISFYLDEPLGTVKSRIHFARKLLKERLVRF